ncbi:MAG: L-lactate permease [Rubrobacter sp.]|nr:L-lactate permease [Rubrobacter sp.]
MFQQVYEPVAGSLVLSTLVAIIPIAVLFVLLAVLRVAAQWASLASLATAFVIALVVYGMPVGLALNSTLLGAAFGLFPIVWIVIKEWAPEDRHALPLRSRINDPVSTCAPPPFSIASLAF